MRSSCEQLLLKIAEEILYEPFNPKSRKQPSYAV
jgi:hypothetical protein